LERLCNAYWYPVYAYIRRKGHAPENAEDLTQEFFYKLISKSYLGAVDQDKGRFRWFLQSALKGFLANEYDRTQAQKRGGGKKVISFEAGDAENRYKFEPVDGATPESIFDRQWSLLVLTRAVDRLRDEYQAEGKATVFEQLRPYLTGEEDDRSYRDEAAALGMSEGAIRVTVHRLRKRFGSILRSEIQETVTTEHEVDEELNFLAKVIRG